MRKGEKWFNPSLSDEERRRLEEEDKELIPRLQRLPKVKPTKSGEVGFRPLKIGEPAPETPHEKWKREKAERLAKGPGSNKDTNEDS
ncbi:MAG: hypothetical protein AAF563_12395 [Pseudomonadota bacterium]